MAIQTYWWNRGTKVIHNSLDSSEPIVGPIAIDSRKRSQVVSCSSHHTNEKTTKFRRKKRLMKHSRPPDLDSVPEWKEEEEQATLEHQDSEIDDFTTRQQLLCELLDEMEQHKQNSEHSVSTEVRRTLHPKNGLIRDQEHQTPIETSHGHLAFITSSPEITSTRKKVPFSVRKCLVNETSQRRGEVYIPSNDDSSAFLKSSTDFTSSRKNEASDSNVDSASLRGQRTDNTIINGDHYSPVNSGRDCVTNGTPDNMYLQVSKIMCSVEAKPSRASFDQIPDPQEHSLKSYVRSKSTTTFEKNVPHESKNAALTPHPFSSKQRPCQSDSDSDDQYSDFAKHTQNSDRCQNFTESEEEADKSFIDMSTNNYDNEVCDDKSRKRNRMEAVMDLLLRLNSK